MTQPMPEWLRRTLIAAGKLDTDGYTRRARMRTCRRCRQWVVVGLDDDPCGVPVRADPVDLDPAAEAVAIASGRPTFDLIAGPSLQYRDQFRIPGDRPYPVLTEHRCDHPAVPAAAVLAAFRPPTKTTTADRPPF